MDKNILNQLNEDKKNELLEYYRNKKNKKKEENVFYKQNNKYNELAPTQKRLWFLQQLDIMDTSYNMPFSLKLKGKLDYEALTKSFKIILKENDCLRSSFPVIDGVPKILISDEIHINISSVSINSEKDIDVLLDKEAKQIFNLEEGPLYKITLVKLNETEHYLVFVAHHIIFDGISSAILIKKFVDNYNKLLSNQEILNIKGQKSYLEYAFNENQWIKSEDAKLEKDYWLSELSGELPILDFPYIFQDGIEECGMRKKTIIENNLQEKIFEFSSKNKISIFSILLGAYGLLLNKYTQMEDIIIGTPFAGRYELAYNNIIGNFINTLPIRIRLNKNESIKEYLFNVWDKFKAAYDNQRLPFNEIVNLVKSYRDIDVLPIYQTLFVYQNYFDENIEMINLETEVIYLNNGKSKFDISLSIGYTGKKLECVFEYNNIKIPEWMIENIAKHYIRLLELIIENSHENIDGIMVLNDDELNNILYQWNDTNLDFNRERIVYKLFEEQVDKTPNDIALIYGDNKLSYKDLDKWTNKISNFLYNNKVERNNLVGIFMYRSMEMVASIHGIMKCGAAYVPIDPEYPLERIKFMVRNANMSVIFTQTSLFNQIKKAIDNENIKIIFVDDKNSEYLSMSEERSNIAVEPSDISYMIYTSGSTGNPKGVMNTNEALCNRILWMQKEYNIGPGDKVLQKTPYCFDVSVWEFVWPLVTGSTLVIAEPGGHRDATYLCKTIIEYGINIMHFVPSMLNIFLLDSQVPYCTSLKKVFSSGEALNFSVVEKFYELLPNTELHNLYGPTEAAIDVTYWDCSVNYKKNIVPIGYPINNVYMYVLDDNQKPVPIGAFGELYIGGIGLAKGYYNNEDLTKEKFLKNPFLKDADERIYRTGDIGRYDISGVIEYNKRKDFQVKLRGQRIELGEIEAALEQHPHINKAVALVYKDFNGLQDLMAFIVLDGISDINIKELKEYLGKHLPQYMIPSFFNKIEEIPLSLNGKVDRKKLESLIVIERTGEKESIKPRTKTEEVIFEICDQLLGVGTISMNDNLIELGASSLIIASLVYKLRDRFNIELDFKYVYENPTIEKLANTIDEDYSDKEPNIDLNDDVKNILSSEIRSNLVAPCFEEEGVFLTGTTGFVGAFLLDELQKKYKKIYILIREKDKEKALLKLKKNQEKYLLDLDESKIEVVLGDLSIEKLGMDVKDYENVSKKTNLIIHNGALVNYSYTYGLLRETNVIGVDRVVELAVNFRKKQIYYISSLHVFSDGDATNNKIIYEETKPKYYQNLKIGYSQSKWSAEQLLIGRAEQLKLEYKIFRLGRVGGASDSGAMQSQDLVWLLIKICLELKVYPNIEMEVSFIPVDFVAKFISEITSVFDKNVIYHIFNKSTLTSKEIFKVFKSMGFELSEISLEKWIEKLREKSEENINNSEYMVIYDLIKNINSSEEIPRIYDSKNFDNASKVLGIKYSITNVDMLKKYLNWQIGAKNEN